MVNSQDVFWIFAKFAVYSCSYILGRLNYGITSFIPLTITTVLHDYSNHKRTLQRINTQNILQGSDRAAILPRLDEIPAWVIFPDFERAEWFNTTLRRIWPQLNELVGLFVKKFEKKLQANLIMSTFKFTQIDLGKCAPRITGIKVYDKNFHNDDLMIDLNVSYFGDCNLTFSLNGIEGGIKNVEAEGALRVIVKPHLSEPPYISAVQIYFLRHPMTNFELTSALVSLDMFSTGDLIRSVLKDLISKMLVYPNKVDIILRPSGEESKFHLPSVDGVINVEIISVEEIEECEKAFVSSSLGDEIGETKAKKITDGMANFNNSCFKLISYKNGDQQLQISVISKNNDLKFVIGRISLPVDEIKLNKFIWRIFPLSPAGKVSAKITWLEASLKREDFDDHQNQCLLQVFIDSIRNLNSKYRPYVEIMACDEIKQTQSLMMKNDAAKYETHLNFIIRDPEMVSLDVKVVDQSSDLTLGQYSYGVAQLFMLKNFENQLQVFPLNGSLDFEIILALKLNALKIPLEAK